MLFIVSMNKIGWRTTEVYILRYEVFIFHSYSMTTYLIFYQIYKDTIQIWLDLHWLFHIDKCFDPANFWVLTMCLASSQKPILPRD